VFAVNWADFIGALDTLAGMKRAMSRRLRVTDRIVFQTIGKTLSIEFPGGEAIVPAEGTGFKKAIRIKVGNLELMRKGLFRFEKEAPMVFLSLDEDFLLVQCEGFSLRIAIMLS